MLKTVPESKIWSLVKIGLVTVEIGQMSQGQMSQDKSCKRYAKAPKKQRKKKRYNNMEEDWGTQELIEAPTDMESSSIQDES